MKKILFTISLCVLLFDSPIYAQWEHLNFVYGGFAGAITCDSSGYLFVASGNSYQIYRSTNGGNSWQNFTNGFPNVGINCFMSTNGATYAGTNGQGIYKTTNHGVNWFACNNGVGTYCYVYSFTASNQYIFSGTSSNGVYRSSNGGSNWESVNNGIGFTHGIHAMTIKDGNIFASSSLGSEGFMYRSSNNGLNWTLINNELPTFFMEYLVKCNNKIFTSNSTSFYFSTNNGDNWVQIPLGSCTGCSLLAKGDTLFASISTNPSTFMITTNGGNNWNTVTSNLTVGRLINFIFTSQGFFGTCSYYSNIYKSTNWCTNWQTIVNGFEDMDLINVTARNNIVIAGASGYGGTFRSTNYGESWNNISSLGTVCNKIIWKNNELYTFKGQYVMRSTDFGLTFFQQGNSPAVPSIYSLAIYNNSFLIVTDMYIYRSANSGYNWIQSNTGLPTSIMGMSRLFNKDSICFVTVQLFSPTIYSSLFRSTNFGLSWDSIPGSSSFTGAGTIIYNPNDYKLYLGKSNGVYTSTNLGNNWIAINNGLPPSKNVTSLFFNGDTIYASLKPGGIYRATIQNQTWSPYNDGLTNLNVNSIYGSNDYLYAGVTYGGFFRRHANISNSIENNSGVIKEYTLYQNYPNPFNPTTSIKYSIPANQHQNVKIVVCDILGKEVTTLVNEKQNAGTYEATFDATNLSSGIYFYKLQAGDFVQVRKMILLK